MTAPASSGRVPVITAGMRLDIAIKDAGIKVGDLADQLGIDRATLSRWINDRHRRPIPALYLRTIAAICDVDEEWLRTGKGDAVNFRSLGVNRPHLAAA